MIFVIEFEARNIDCELWLNDFPITKRGPEFGWAWNGPVNQYLKDGANELCLVLTPSGDQSFSNPGNAPRWYAGPPAEAEVTVKFSRYPKGAIMGGPDAVELANLSWKADDLHCGMMWPHLRSEVVELDERYGEMAWERGEPLQLGDEDVERNVLGLLNELHRSIDEGDHSTWLDLNDARLGDHDTLYRGRKGGRRQTAMMEMQESRNQDEFGMAPVITDTSAWRLVAGGRAIQCVAPDGEPALRELTKEDGSTDSYPVFAAKVDGRWIQVRG